MRYLLDTVTFLHQIEDSPALSPQAKRILTADASALLLSYVSIWEIAIKVGIGKLKFQEPLEDFLLSQLSLNKIALLPISVSQMVAAGLLPLHHRDPFDRLLVAQAMSENLPLLSNDAQFDAYGINRIW